MTTVGEALIQRLAAHGVRCVFGIPGVHTIELYRALSRSGIRHITPRHEQGAGFMADGYARVSGKPGVALVITGPGVTNTITAMGQARADSVPILVISGVNARSHLGKGLGYLHELPDQSGLLKKVALHSETVMTADELAPALDRAFKVLTGPRKGPVHLEVPLDVAAFLAPPAHDIPVVPPHAPDPQILRAIAERIARARNAVILVGGGTRHCAAELRCFAEKLDAPVVQTVNARGGLWQHPLSVPASPSLQAVRALIEAADLVLALGTELGQTDYDMYGTGKIAKMTHLIRIDTCPEQLKRHATDLSLAADVKDVLPSLTASLGPMDGKGEARATATRQAAWEEIGLEMRAMVGFLDAARIAVPQALIVGDSTQPIYAGNLYFEPDTPGAWFNAATGFGALGYALPAAVGAALAAPNTPVICISGDGGAQFSLAEMLVAVQESLPILFVIWNSNGYQEIDSSMRAAKVPVVGCDPEPPDFESLAKAFRLSFKRCPASDPKTFARLLQDAAKTKRPALIEIEAPYCP